MAKHERSPKDDDSKQQLAQDAAGGPMPQHRPALTTRDTTRRPLMTETHGTALAEDPVQETARLARVHVQYGELRVPIRVLAHLTDGPVSVRLLRGEAELTQCE